MLSQAISLNAQIDTISYKLQKSLNPGQTLTDLLPDTENSQHRLSGKLDRAQVLHMIENSSMKDAACLKSHQGKGSVVWLDCIPSSQKLALCLICSVWQLLLGWVSQCHCLLQLIHVNVGKHWMMKVTI